MKMDFGKLISIVSSWPILLIALTVVMAVFGWRKYRLAKQTQKNRLVEQMQEDRLAEQTQEIVENASGKTFVIISVVLALVISARITGEYYYELFGIINQFTHGTGVEAPWFIVVIGLLGASLIGMFFFAIADRFAAAKWDHLSAELDRTRAVMAARDPLAGCEVFKFSVDKDGNMIKTLLEKW